MGLRYLLDTHVCIYIAKQRPPTLAQRFSRLTPGSVAMSLVTYGELRYGAEKSQRSAEALVTLDRLVELIPVLEPNKRVGKTYGWLRAHLDPLRPPRGGEVFPARAAKRRSKTWGVYRRGAGAGCARRQRPPAGRETLPSTAVSFTLNSSP